MYFIGRIFFNKKDYTFAREYFELCFSNDPDNEYYNLHLGKTLLALKSMKNQLNIYFFMQNQRKTAIFILDLPIIISMTFQQAAVFSRNVKNF